MKRQLNREERELTMKGIKRIEKDITDLRDQLSYNEALVLKQQYLRDFDDTWRKYLRNQKTEQDGNTLKLMKNAIGEKEHTLEEMKKQLKEGVEKPTGV